MALIFVLIFISAAIAPIHTQITSTESPTTLYEVYNAGGLVNPNGSALIAEGPSFTLNGKDFHILSGAIHYFRVVPEYWQDRIRKLKACGCNTLETYVPWNLHEELPGQFNFAGRLDLRRFLQIAQQEDVFVILRPGPYICSEWEYGGLPSWLLRTTNITVRTSDTRFTSAVYDYYQQLIPLIADLQFSRGGSIIAVQVENEYGSYEVDDPDYLKFLTTTMKDLGVVELLVNSDSCGTDECRMRGTLPGLLMTANFQDNPDMNLDRLARLQPDRPLMVMEFWTGWFDHWGENHHTLDITTYAGYVNRILERNSSINLYMFHGGTSFGFMNGANSVALGLIVQPDVTSYDYDAPLSESGDYTPKYNVTKQIFTNFSKGRLWDVPLPPPPAEALKVAYGSLVIEKYLNFDDILSLITPQSSPDILPMELLNLYGNSGQNFGYIIYRTNVDLPLSATTLTINGRVRDYGQVVLDNDMVATVKWDVPNPSVLLNTTQVGTHDLKILVGNSGRANGGQPVEFNFEQQCRGLKDPVTLDATTLTNWNIYSLDFNQNFLSKLTTVAPWKNLQSSNVTYPGLMSTTLTIAGAPQDTFLSMNGWSKGIVIINDFLLGRFWNIGPQVTLYVPAPILRQGDNTIYICETYIGSNAIHFQDTPNLGPV